ncbi:hypothetical protein B1H20_16710 [Streptomyces violaceoruber]|uniref:Uncharacterized protein n=3 Tax=Streptomyces TaxID=1883 RepID=A0A1V0UCL4_STRVN|nr:hypothetical protein B1H20_16710 [Streptomyces violaceoruber]
MCCVFGAGADEMGEDASRRDFRVGDVLRVSCPQARARVAHVSSFHASVEWPLGEIDPESGIGWNGRRAFAVPAGSIERIMSLFRTEPEPSDLRVGDSCLVGVPETLVRVIDIGRYDPPQDVGWLPRPHTMLVVVPADLPDEALPEDAGDTIDLESAAPLTIELVSRG